MTGRDIFSELCTLGARIPRKIEAQNPLKEFTLNLNKRPQKGTIPGRDGTLPGGGGKEELYFGRAESQKVFEAQNP